MTLFEKKLQISKKERELAEYKRIKDSNKSKMYYLLIALFLVLAIGFLALSIFVFTKDTELAFFPLVAFLICLGSFIYTIVRTIMYKYKKSNADRAISHLEEEIKVLQAEVKFIEQEFEKENKEKESQE
jgi:membrane protein YdbS with pleckstrin-like domain